MGFIYIYKAKIVSNDQRFLRDLNRIFFIDGITSDTYSNIMEFTDRLFNLQKCSDDGKPVFTVCIQSWYKTPT